MSDREDDLARSLAGYLEGYATYSGTEHRRPQRGAETAGARRNRPLLGAAVAALAAVVIGTPLGITLLLRSGTTSPAGTVQRPNGVVVGTLEAVGGPPPGTPRPLPGAVTLRD